MGPPLKPKKRVCRREDARFLRSIPVAAFRSDPRVFISLGFWSLCAAKFTQRLWASAASVADLAAGSGLLDGLCRRIHRFFRRRPHQRSIAADRRGDLRLWHRRALGVDSPSDSQDGPLHGFQGAASLLLRRLRAHGLAILATFLVASADEFHQSFLPNRTGQFSDVLLDTCGAAVLGLLLFLAMLAVERRRQTRTRTVRRLEPARAAA